MARSLENRKITGPVAWKGSDFGSKDAVAFDLGPRHLRAFEEAILVMRRDGLGIGDIGQSQHAFAAIADDIAAIRTELVSGRGLVILRGWPIDKYTLDEIGLLYGWVGQHFGKPVIQSGKGDRLGYVEDVPQPGKINRGYRSSAELSMHTDSDDIVGLLSMRQAKSGGLSRIVSAAAVYNEILSTHADLLPVLAEGFHVHWNGEEAPGEPPVTEYRVPVLSFTDGLISCCYSYKYIEEAFTALGTPATPLEREALATFEAVSARPDLFFEFRLDPGECTFINNYTTLHSRTGFEDWPEPERRRLLLRLWLQAHEPRPIHANVRRYYGSDGMHATEKMA